MRLRRALPCLCIAAAILCLLPHETLAQARNPFSVGVSEGGGAATGLTGWILGWQQHFDLLMRAAVRSMRIDPAALWTLTGLAFAYGVFHAAGPGHGKAVLAAYLVANERALRRGLFMAALAALLQAIVAIALVGGLAILLGGTARTMRNAAQWIEVGSYAAIAAVGAMLVWRKGGALWRESRSPTKLPVAAAFVCVDAHELGHVHGPACGHVHMPDPALLAGARFSLRDAASAVIAAGLRPCSGAILVLVFAASQGIFRAGIVATFAMAAGTAVTTGALAASSVYARTVAQRMTARSGARGLLALRSLELAAAIAVLLFGLGLVTGTLSGLA